MLTVLFRVDVGVAKVGGVLGGVVSSPFMYESPSRQRNSFSTKAAVSVEQQGKGALIIYHQEFTVATGRCSMGV